MLDRIRSRLRGRTPAEIARLGGATIAHAVRRQMPAARRARAADLAFDRRWGTDTSSIVGVGDLGLGPRHAASAVHYEPSSEAMLTRPLAHLRLDPARWYFVDYGAGKGRMLMIAMTLGFPGITGVELSPRLCTIARGNIQRFARHHPDAPAAAVHCGDATAFQPTGDRILAYFYNPFDADILAPVRDRLEAAAASGSEVQVIYANPKHLAVFADAPAWQVERLDDDTAVARVI
jgi:hypothetical protein